MMGYMEWTFTGEVIEWRGPAPYLFVAMTPEDSEDLKEAASGLTYWGQVPVHVTVGGTEFTTALFPKDGRYLVPVKAAVQRAEAIGEGAIVEVALRLNPARRKLRPAGSCGRTTDEERRFSQSGQYGDEKGIGMDHNGRVQVTVSRPIAAPAARIFRVLADPASHPALDGSGMLRAAPAQPVPGRAGDTFTMAMHLPELGSYLMLNRITVFEQDRQICWEPTPGDAAASRAAGLPVGASQGYSWGFQLRPDGGTTIVTEMFDCTEAVQVIRDAVEDGQTWVPVMHRTLERLAAIVEQPPAGS